MDSTDLIGACRDRESSGVPVNFVAVIASRLIPLMIFDGSRVKARERDCHVLVRWSLRSRCHPRENIIVLMCNYVLYHSNYPSLFVAIESLVSSSALIDCEPVEEKQVVFVLPGQISRSPLDSVVVIVKATELLHCPE